MKFLAWLEAYGFAWGNGDFSAGPGIAADACFAGLDGKDAKSTEFDAVACDQSLLHAVEDGVHRRLCLRSRQTGALNNPLYKILLNHLGRHPWAVIFLD